MQQDDRARMILGYQVGVLTALTGVVVGKRLSCRKEIAQALACMADSECDAVASEMLNMASQSLVADKPRATSGPGARRSLEVIVGGKR